VKGQVDGIVYSHKRDEGLSRVNGMRNRQALKRKWLKGYHSRHCRAISSYSVIKHWYPSFLYTLAYSHSLSFSLFSVPISSPYMLIYIFIYLYVEMYRYVNRKQQREATAIDFPFQTVKKVEKFSSITINSTFFRVCCTTGPSARSISFQKKMNKEML